MAIDIGFYYRILGGGTGALDAEPVNNLDDGALANVVDAGNGWFYVFNASSGKAPDGFKVVIPLYVDSESTEYTGDGRWELQSDILDALNDGGIYPGEIVFITSGANFAPVIVLDGAANVQWTFSDGTTSSSLTPTASFGTSAVRTQRLRVTPWDALYRINLGYNRDDGGQATDALGNTFEVVPAQPVTEIRNLNIVRDSLVYLCGSRTPLTALNVQGFTALHTLEFYSSSALASANVYGTSNLRRACFENSPIGFLDFSASPRMEDVRGANCQLRELRWGNTGANVWHICVRENSSYLDPTTWPSMTQFPIIRDCWISGNGLTGNLVLDSTVVSSVWAYNNNFLTMDFTGAFQTGSHYIDAYNNPNCTQITIDNCPGLTQLNASGCALTQANVNYILITLDNNGRSSGTVNLSGGTNAAPSSSGLTAQTNLESKGWIVTLNEEEIPVALELEAVKIGANGQTWTFEFNTAAYIGTGGSGGLSVTMADVGAITLTYQSGLGSDTLTYSGSPTVEYDDTVSTGLNYVQPGNGIEDAEGNDLSSFSNFSVTNNSAVNAPAVSLDIENHVRTTRFNQSTDDIATPSMNVTEGNLLLVFVAMYTPSSPYNFTVTDSQSNVYTPAGQVATFHVTGRWYYTYAGSTGSVVVTASYATGQYRSINLYEISGAHPTAPIDVFGVSTSNAPITYTTAYAHELLIVMGHNDYQTMPHDVIPTTGWTNLYDTGTMTMRPSRPAIYKINNSIETSATVSISTGSTPLWIQNLIGIRAA